MHKRFTINQQQKYSNLTHFSPKLKSPSNTAKIIQQQIFNCIFFDLIKISSANSGQMYLIPLQQTIYFNETFWPSATLIQTIYILAIAYHPSLSNIMYLLYGSTNSATNGSRFGSLILMVRNSQTQAFIQNDTLDSSIKCDVNCSIKATEYLFLIETQANIVIYPIIPSTNTVNLASTFFNRMKLNISGILSYSRNADIHSNRYAYINQTYSLFGINSRTSPVYTYPHTLNAQQILDVGLTDEWVFSAINASNTNLVFYSCVQCIYNGSLDSNSSISDDMLILETRTNANSIYRLHQGYTLVNSSVEGAMAFWGMTQGYSYKYLVNQTGYKGVENYSIPQSMSTANNHYFLTFGVSIALSQRTFLEVASPQYNQYSTFNFPSIVKLAAISKDSQKIATHLYSDSWNVKQYQFVLNCSQYNASVINNTRFCQCHQYDGVECASLASSASTAQTSNSNFPIVGVIGAVVGIVTILVTTLLIKKHYKKCLKRHRTPWKYNPVELMSFQI